MKYGINDADYAVKDCPFYNRWRHLLDGVFSEVYHKRRPTYTPVTICDEWLTFSCFKSWVESSPWEGLEIDKDLFSGVHYSPETCVMIPRVLNTFLKGSTCGLQGSHLHKSGKWVASCSDPLKRHTSYLGLFLTEEEAHIAWKTRKHLYSCEFAEIQSDPRVADALRLRYV